MFKFKVEGSSNSLYKIPSGKKPEVKGYDKIANNMNGSKVNSSVNNYVSPRKSISTSNIKK